MNVAAYQKKKENENTGKIEAGIEKRQSTNFGEIESCHSAVVQRAARQKNGLYEVAGTLGKPNIYFDSIQTELGTALPC